jgi:uncharacterized protein
VTSLRSLLVLLAFTWFLSPAAALAFDVPDVPNPRREHGGWVSDPSGALGASATALEQRLSALHAATQAEVAVAVVPSIGDAVPRDFATALFQHWGVGRKGKDDGVLVLHVLDQRRVEIETGYGLEAALPDVKCSWLIRDAVLPAFKAGDFARGHEALARGIEHAIQHPEATRVELLAAALAEADIERVKSLVSDAEAEAESGSGGSEELELLQRFAPELSSGALLATGAWAVRRRAHRALYRDEKRRPSGPWASWLFGLLGSLGVTLFGASSDIPDAMGWTSTGVLGLLTGLFGFGAVRTFRKARERYAPRNCGACGSAMKLLDDARDDAFLEAGQRVEERLRSYDYDVWKCSCGEKVIIRYDDEGEAAKCAKCGYRTEQSSRRVIQAATEHSTGLAEDHYHCAHCKAQRVQQVTLPRITRSSSSSSGSSSGGGSSFGGGRSGGGGAGGSY